MCDTTAQISTQTAKATGCIIIQRRSGNPSPEYTLEEELASRIAMRGVDVVLIPDLYSVADEDPVWDELRKIDAIAAVFGWLHPRPMKWLLERHGIGGDSLLTLDLRAFATAGDAAEAVRHITPTTGSEAGEAGGVTELAGATGERWYPVVDRARCVNCQHCLQFCLFGVYTLDADGQVRVSLPDNCKNGCPACARICPESAIMFPLYEKDAAICGAPGKYIELDAPAKRMFYARTGKPCPVCGQTEIPAGKRAASADICPECGRAIQTPTADDRERPSDTVLDEIDALIDELDRMTPRRES